MNIFDKADDMVRRSHGEMTREEALRELGRRGGQARRYGRTKKTKPDAARRAVEPGEQWWNRD